MKAFKLYLLALLTASFAVSFGCDESSIDNENGTDVDPDGGDTDFVPNTSECDQSKLCSALDHPEDCVASFDLGTCQAGYPGTAGTGAGGLYDADSLYYDSDYPYVGWYSYNDYSWQNSDAEMIPLKNNTGSEPAAVLNSCSADDDFVLHAKGNNLWSEWGVGLGLDWSGENNPACYLDDGETEDPDSIACWTAYFADDRIKMDEIEALPECDTERKVDCAIHSKRFKVTRDLSMYKGLGFWIVTTPENESTTIDVHFPIPATTRFESAGADGGECDSEDGTSDNDCYNDFAATVTLSPNDVGKWVYKEVLFKDLAQNPFWGFKFPEGTPFPPTESIGLKFQFGYVANVGPDAFDFYIDDIRLIR